MLTYTAKVIETRQPSPNRWETLRVPVSAEIEDKIIAQVKTLLTVASSFVMSDYDKGTITPRLTARSIQERLGCDAVLK